MQMVIIRNCKFEVKYIRSELNSHGYSHIWSDPIDRNSFFTSIIRGIFKGTGFSWDLLKITNPVWDVRGFGCVFFAHMSTLLGRARQLQALVMQWPRLPAHEDQGTCCNGNDSHEGTQS